jgi:NTP pyrophosphatase (non-canonical NTP hydrolase)
MFTWTRLQGEVTRWADKNFPNAPASWQVLGLIEELGELAHAHLKKQQGIRGSSEKHIAAGRDAIADSVIFLMHACSSLGWNAQELLRTESPLEFQATFAAPSGRSPLIYAFKNLARVADLLEAAEIAPTPIEKDVSTSAAKQMTLSYVGGLAAYCSMMGWSMQEIIDEVWPVVRQRDWTKNKVDGTSDVVTVRGELDGHTVVGVGSRAAIEQLDLSKVEPVVDIDPTAPPVKVNFGDPIKDYDDKGKRKRHGA